MQWISVKDRLPEIGEKVLVLFGICGDISIAYNRNDTFWIKQDYYCSGGNAIDIKNNDYWLPIDILPELPKEVK